MTYTITIIGWKNVSFVNESQAQVAAMEEHEVAVKEFRASVARLRALGHTISGSYSGHPDGPQTL